jgi:hypothetical protein
VRTYYRTSPRTAVSFGCLGSTAIGVVLLAAVALGGTLVLGAAALVAAIFFGWFAMWIMPISLYRAFAKEFSSPTAGVIAVLGWFAFCGTGWLLVTWIA